MKIYCFSGLTCVDLFDMSNPNNLYVCSIYPVLICTNTQCICCMYPLVTNKEHSVKELTKLMFVCVFVVKLFKRWWWWDNNQKYTFTMHIDSASWCVCMCVCVRVCVSVCVFLIRMLDFMTLLFYKKKKTWSKINCKLEDKTLGNKCWKTYEERTQ